MPENDELFERGIAALVDLYLFYAKGAGGPERVFRDTEKAQAAHYFVTEYQKRLLDSGPQPTLHVKAVTNVYDEPRPQTSATAGGPVPRLDRRADHLAPGRGSEEPGSS